MGRSLGIARVRKQRHEGLSLRDWKKHLSQSIVLYLYRCVSMVGAGVYVGESKCLRIFVSSWECSQI